MLFIKIFTKHNQCYGCWHRVDAHEGLLNLNTKVYNTPIHFCFTIGHGYGSCWNRKEKKRQKVSSSFFTLDMWRLFALTCFQRNKSYTAQAGVYTTCGPAQPSSAPRTQVLQVVVARYCVCASTGWVFQICCTRNFDRPKHILQVQPPQHLFVGKSFSIKKTWL